MGAEQTAEKAQSYPMLVAGRWVASPLDHVAFYAARAERDRESHVAVPRDLLIRVAAWRECGGRRTFTCDEDGPLTNPFEATCRREKGHDDARFLDHLRQHSNGYYTWRADLRTSPGTTTQGGAA